jgi:hypothetical protein
MPPSGSAARPVNDGRDRSVGNHERTILVHSGGEGPQTGKELVDDVYEIGTCMYDHGIEGPRAEVEVGQGEESLPSLRPEERTLVGMRGCCQCHACIVHACMHAIAWGGIRWDGIGSRLVLEFGAIATLLLLLTRK